MAHRCCAALCDRVPTRTKIAISRSSGRVLARQLTANIHHRWITVNGTVTTVSTHPTL